MRLAYAIAFSAVLALVPACRNQSDTPPIPDLSYVRAPSNETDKLVVFVHGFGSDATAAWTNGRSKAYWPQLLADDRDLSTFAVLTATYRSPFLRQAGTIEQAAVALGIALRDESVYVRFSHIVFIAHSTGGLVTRRLLAKLFNPGDLADLRRVSVVFFFATPTSGAPIADLARWLSANPQTRDLDASEMNTFLHSVDNDWEELLRQRTQQTGGRPLVFCGYELLDTAIRPIVPRLYSRTICDETPRPFDRDHFTLVKPDDRNDAVYRWTKQRLLSGARRRGSVLWDGGEKLGTLVERLRTAYRDGRVPEQVRFASDADALLGSLWIRRAEYRRDSWAELLQAVAGDYSCLGAKAVDPGRLVELHRNSPLKACSGRGLHWSVCAEQDCGQAP